MDGDLFGQEHRCFGCGPRNPLGLQLKFERDGDDVVTEFLPTPEHESVPNVLHGGLVMTIADELGGWVLIALLDKFGFTGSMNSRFVRPVRTGTKLVGRGRIARHSRRLVQVVVELLQEGELCFKAELTFVLLDQSGTEKMLGGPIPGPWRKYFRVE